MHSTAFSAPKSSNTMMNRSSSSSSDVTPSGKENDRTAKGKLSVLGNFISLDEEGTRNIDYPPFVRIPEIEFDVWIDKFTWIGEVTYQNLQHFNKIIIQIYANEQYRLHSEDEYQISFNNPTQPANFEGILAKLNLKYKYTKDPHNIFLVFMKSLSEVKNLLLHCLSACYIRQNFYFEINKTLEFAKINEKIKAAKNHILANLYQIMKINQEGKAEIASANVYDKPPEVATKTLSSTALSSTALSSSALSSSALSSSALSSSSSPNRHDTEHASGTIQRVGVNGSLESLQFIERPDNFSNIQLNLDFDGSYTLVIDRPSNREEFFKIFNQYVINGKDYQFCEKIYFRPDKLQVKNFLNSLYINGQLSKSAFAEMEYFINNPPESLKIIIRFAEERKQIEKKRILESKQITEKEQKNEAARYSLLPNVIAALDQYLNSKTGTTTLFDALNSEEKNEFANVAYERFKVIMARANHSNISSYAAAIHQFKTLAVMLNSFNIKTSLLSGCINRYNEMLKIPLEINASQPTFRR